MPRTEDDGPSPWGWFNPRTMRGLGLAALLIVAMVLLYLAGPALPGAEDPDATPPSVERAGAAGAGAP